MIFRLCLIAFMGGVGVSFFTIHRLDLFTVFSALLALIVLLVFMWGMPHARSILFIGTMFLIGIARGVVQEEFLEREYDVSDRQEKISFTGEITRDPLIRGGRQGLALRVKEGDIPPSSKIFVWTSLFPTHYRWEHVTVQCKGISSEVCSYASVSAIPTGEASILRRLSESRMWLSGVIERYLPQPHAGLLGSILFGARSSLSQNLVGSFNRTGLTHIVAISGYNVALLIGMMSALLLVCGLHRKKLPLTLGVGIVLFVLFTGASAATVRAGIMGYLAVIAQSIGRRVDGLRLVLVSAAVMTAIHPHIISDLGFQLSFLATLGLILGSPLFESFHVSFLPRALFTIIAQSLSAIIFTAPLIFGVFGSFSVVALFANIFVVPTIPLVMSYGMAWTLLASIAPSGMHPFITAFGWPVWLVLEYIIRCVDFFSSLPFASLFWSDIVVRWAVVAIAYGILAGTLIWFHRKRRLY